MKGKYLQITTEVWAAKSTFKDKSGRTRPIKNYQEARDYAQQHGYLGIRISYK